MTPATDFAKPQLEDLPMSFMEHRWGSRIGIHAAVWLAHGSEGCSRRLGHMAIASLSGALIHTDLKLPRWARLDVILGPHRVPGFVVRVLADALAIEWCELAPAAVCTLIRSRAVDRPKIPTAIESCAP